jgi:tetratricopeptide (TPR) repeat protein
MVPRTRSLPLLAAALAAGLTGCASFEERHAGFEVGPAEWRAGLARRGAGLADVPNPMAVTPAMAAAARGVGGIGHDEDRLNRLRSALLNGRDYTFEYERGSTFSAADAFENRRGDCVSFTNLFVALGRSLGIRLQAALVSNRGTSEREGNLVVVSRHMVAVFGRLDGPSVKVYDFSGTLWEPGGRLTPLDDWAVAAVRSSNDGIVHLGRGETSEAVRDLEIAVKLAPKLGSLYANLALAKWRVGDVAGAFAAIERGLVAEPGCPSLLQNLAALYVDWGKPAEARAAMAALDLHSASPYALIVRGDLELQAGDPAAALRNYHRAASLDPKLADSWLSIARAEFARGRPDAARKAAQKALKRDPSSDVARKFAEANP